ncbi:MAG: precorrin-6y C5,15-methyltransferase (decarboxylating) subunit CbiE [Tannerellaceae bacterium]|jgi:precorrin-6Y C5,15-methyltransferase (decarboxylating)|nr:precorrin-6y C5,15-methyltransferase (decarboxylating) subunit CbiE [Tannerellaceae bacterium]
MNRFYVIGINDNPEQCFTPEVLDLIEAGSVFSGGRRHYEIVQSLLPEASLWIDITVPLDSVFEQYMAYPAIIVFASGDPLFYGFANTIQKRLPEAEIKLYPSFNSLQLLAHRLLMPYHDMRIVSLTGRPWHELDRALIERASKIGILTDSKEHTPATIANRMLSYNLSNYILYVGEHLGHPTKQRIQCLGLEQAAMMEFESPNCVILLQNGTPYPRMYGIPDELFAFLNGREKMITKMPIRLLSLQMLGLEQCHSFWDIGFCTGSVSIEAKNLFPHLQVTAFEIRKEGQDLMEVNSRRCAVPGINYHIADFCQVDLSELEKPDAVFIGGHGGQLKKIVRRIEERLTTNGRIVFNSVSEESRHFFHEAIKESNMTIEKELSVTIDTFNTITICQTIKKK